MRTSRDLARNVIVGIDCQGLRALHGGRARISMRQYEARHAVGQRRLADALCTADQPGVRNSSAAIGGKQRRLGLAMSEQLNGFARMFDGNFFFGLAGVHAGEAVVAIANRWSRSAVHTCAETASGLAVASIRTQRLGSSAAIWR